jgi:hypothetical protein
MSNSNRSFQWRGSNLRASDYGRLGLKRCGPKSDRVLTDRAAAACETPRDGLIRLGIGFFPYHLQRGGEPLGDAPSITVRHGVPLDRLD